MNSLQKLLACMMIVCISVSYSCNNDDDNDPTGCNWTTEVQAEADAFSAAAITYGNNPTTANCEAYRSAGLAYFAELEDHLDCAAAAGTQAELQAYINSTQDSLNQLPC